MDKSGKYYIVKERALPEVLLKVVEAKRLIDSEKAMTVQEATDATGISRSSFYKYKDDIIPFHENVHGRTITLSIQLDDEPGLLSGILGKIADLQSQYTDDSSGNPHQWCCVIDIEYQTFCRQQEIFLHLWRD